MRLGRGCGVGLAISLALVVAAGLWLYIWLFYDLPTPDHLDKYMAAQNSRNSYTPVPLSEIPSALRWATIATEDRRFYASSTHIDVVGVLHRIWFNLASGHGHILGDNATITGRLAACLVRASGKGTADPVRQRMRELALTIFIKRRYSKDEILVFYLNSAYYGNRVYGAEPAAQYYFGKHVRDLDLAECAMLEVASLHPHSDLSKNQEERQAVVVLLLERMVEDGYISEEEARRATEEKLIFAH